MTLIATNEEATSSGAIIYWRLGGNVQATRLRNAWIAAGLDEDLLPPKPDALAALKRVLKSIETDEIRVDSVERDTTHGKRGLAVLKKNKMSTGHAMWVTQWQALLDTDDQLAFVTVDGEEFDADIAELISAQYAQERGILPHTAMSVWMVSLIEKCNAVALRDSGGIYFVPKWHLPRWRSFVNVVKTVSKTKPFEIPAMSSESAAEAVLDALTQDCDTFINKVEGELGNVGVRALQTRENLLKTMANKLEAYTDIIGGKVTGLRSKLETLQGHLSTALIAGMTDL